MKFLIVFVFLICLMIGTPLLAAGTNISGQVRHANTYKEIPDVNIFIRNSETGTTSDLNGSFSLELADANDSLYVVFEHISFDRLVVPLYKFEANQTYYMQPRVIQGAEISVQALRENPEILKDLPQPFSLIGARNFDVHGYVDAGDLLRTEQSIQVEEELSGKKTIAIRAGNPDDVIVLYNGIKMNSVYDNIFDLSLINLDEVKHFEIIRGSNTSLYGPEAFSGVINVVPKTHKNYNIRFMQKLGTYASGDWNLQLNRNFNNRLNLSYSHKNGATRRSYESADNEEEYLKNKLSSQMANLVLDLSGNGDKYRERNLSLMYMRSELDYMNTRFDEDLENLNQLLTAHYVGNLAVIDNVNLVGAYQWFDTRQHLAVGSSYFDRHFLNSTFKFRAGKTIERGLFSLLMSYQLEDGELDFKDDRDNTNEQLVGIESALFSRRHHGFVSILKTHLPTQSTFLNLVDVDLSYRYDAVRNKQNQVVDRSVSVESELYFDADQLKNNNWNESTFKFSTQLRGGHKTFSLNSYLNFGSNIKFPTMFQQISSPRSFGPNSESYAPSLSPEKNESLELGIHLTKETNDISRINGWQIAFNYFQNYYENKFRMYYSPGIPIAFFDNVNSAEIFGVESKIGVFLLKSKLKLELGASKYAISEKAAFPFKSDTKLVANLYLDHAGYSLQLHAFRESEQIGWVRSYGGAFWEVRLPGYSNLDLHFSKKFDLNFLKFFANFSARNLLDDDIQLEGISLRDRRYYISFGVEY